MRLPRLKWICKAIEYDRLKSSESNFLYKFIEDFIGGNLTTQTAEEKLEELFAEVQWREVEREVIDAIWSKKEENKEPMLEA